MAIVRANNRVVVDKAAALDKRLSLMAKGLFLLAYSMPEEKDFTEEDIKLFCDSSHEEIFEALIQLKKFGYVRKDESGRSVIQGSPEQSTQID